MQTVSEVYPSKWLRCDDLRGQAAKVVIESATVEPVRQRDGGEAPRVILKFSGKEKRFILNKTQALSLVAQLGTEHFDQWPGATVVLSPARAPNGQATIAITAPAAK